MFKLIADVVRLAIVNPKHLHVFNEVEVEQVHATRIYTVAKSPDRPDRVFNWHPKDVEDVNEYWEELEGLYE